MGESLKTTARLGVLAVIHELVIDLKQGIKCQRTADQTQGPTPKGRDDAAFAMEAFTIQRMWIHETNDRKKTKKYRTQTFFNVTPGTFPSGHRNSPLI